MEVEVLDDKDAGDWVYRGEGAANIVLSYTGRKSLAGAEGLKVKGHCLNGSYCLSEHERLLWRQYEELILAPTKEIATHLYVQRVMNPLLSEKHVDAERICQALKALFDNPQNNLNVFLTGSLVLGGIADTTTGSTEEAVEDLLKFIIQAEDNSRTKCFIELLAETICKSGVLNQLLQVQELDNYDIEGAVHAYYNIISQLCPVCRKLDWGDESSEKWSDLHSLPLEEGLEIVRNFLISATAKDCSLMFCFRQKKDGESYISHNSVFLLSTNQVFAYKVFFIDLDLKPLEKMDYYYDLDQRIVHRHIVAMHNENSVENNGILQMYSTR